MLPLKLLCPPLTDHMPVWIQVPALRTPAASVKTANAERASQALRGNNARSSRLPKTYATTRPVWCSSTCHSHRGRRLQPTNDHISSSSASWTLRTTTAGSDPSLAVTSAGSPGEAPALLFESGHHRDRADTQYAGSAADATAIERHRDHLLFDLWHPPGLVISQ